MRASADVAVVPAGGLRRWLGALAALACSLIIVPAAWAREGAAPNTMQYARIRRVCPPPAPGDATCEALVSVRAAAGSPGARPYVLEHADSLGPAGGLMPSQLASAYEYDPAAGGSGQTVAIVDAFDDPAIEEDLAKFDTHYKLPACTTADGCFKKVGQTGSTTALPKADTSGWSVEISLDVETVHSVCQSCKILLVETNNESFKALAAAVNEAVSLGATEVSNSYGGPEAEMKEAERAAYEHPGIPIVAAAGDDGYYGWDFINQGELGDEMPETPASLPYVVAAGGTSLHLDENGTRASETVWNNNGPRDEIGLASGFAEGATGGGCSTLFTASPWQQSTPGFAASGCAGKRLDADVSAVADPNTGIAIYDTYDCGPECESFGVGAGNGWLKIGGTSLSTPIISALYGLAGGGGVPDPALTLYGHLGDTSSLFDVTQGGNGFCDAQTACHPNSTHGLVDCEGTTACNAAPGFDGPSGVGTPRGLGAFQPLFPTAVVTAPANVAAGVAAAFSSADSNDPYPGGSIAAWSWNWGDGTPESHEADPTHTYAAEGEYTVSLTVADSYGLASVVSRQPVQVISQALAKRHEEEASAKRRREEEAAVKKQHEEELAVTKKEQEEAAARKEQEEKLAAAKSQHEQEEAAKTRQREEEAATSRKREEEAATSRKHEEEAATKKLQEEKAALGSGVEQTAAFRSLVAAPVPDAQLTSTALAAGLSGVLSVNVSCPAGESSCSGTITLRTFTALSTSLARPAKGRRSSIITLATGSFAVAGGKVTTVKLHLSAKTRALLARLHTLRARATVVAHDPAGATHTTQSIVTLRAAKVKHGSG
jgi:PKD repeat protein